MGLSNEERKTGIYWSLYRIDKVVKEWSNRKEVQRGEYISDEIEKVFELADKLWPAVLGGISNAIHWIIGSSSSHSVKQEDTPWEVAIHNFCEKAYEQINKKEDDWYDGPDHTYNAVNSTDIDDLLISGGEWGEAFVFRVYREIETIVYYLRRYNDEFLAGYSDLNLLIGKIMGACFTVFADNENYAKAYVVHEILEKMYGPPYPYREKDYDIVTKIMHKENLHHDFALLMKRQLKDLVPWHVDLVKKYAMALVKLKGGWNHDPDLLHYRMLIVCEFGRHLHEYKHVREKVYEVLVDSPLAREFETYKALIEKKAEEFAKIKKKDDSEDISKYLNVYGINASMQMWDLIKELKAEVSIPEPTKKKKKDKKRDINS